MDQDERMPVFTPKGQVASVDIQREIAPEKLRAAINANIRAGMFGS